jgi:hypothetical protein
VTPGRGRHCVQPTPGYAVGKVHTTFVRANVDISCMGTLTRLARSAATDWRLKLLSVGLAVFLLVSVLLSEHPMIVQPVTVPIAYTGLGPQVVLIDPPRTLRVNVIGMDGSQGASTPSVSATVDASRLSHRAGAPSQRTTTNAALAANGPGVEVSPSVVPITLTVDSAIAVSLPVQVETPRVAPGWTVMPQLTTAVDGGGHPATVAIVGATAQLAGLKAFVTVDHQIREASLDIVDVPVLFARNNGTNITWPPRTVPPTTFAPTTVSIHVHASTSSSIRVVPLRLAVNGSPACGYAVSRLELAPADMASVTGPADMINAVKDIDLGAISIGGRRDDVVVNRSVSAPSGLVIRPSQVRIIVHIYRAFDCAAAGGVGRGEGRVGR